MKERIAILIPALNGARLVGQLAQQCRAWSESVVVIDDGSTDGTSEEARGAGAIVLRHERNRGKGAALKTGFRWALGEGFDGVVTLDVDGQHLPSEIPKLLRAREETGADLIIGDRAHLFEHMLPRRRMANRFSAWSISMSSRTLVRDSQSGFRFYSARLLRSVELRTNGFDLESEAIVRAGLGGFKVTSVPIELGFVDGITTSHYRPVADTLRIAWTVFRTKFFWT